MTSPPIMVSPNASAASAASCLSLPPGHTRWSPRLSSGTSGASGAIVCFSMAMNRMSSHHHHTTTPPPTLHSPALSLSSRFMLVISAKGGSSVLFFLQSMRKSAPSRKKCSAAALFIDRGKQETNPLEVFS